MYPPPKAFDMLRGFRCIQIFLTNKSFLRFFIVVFRTSRLLVSSGIWPIAELSSRQVLSCWFARRSYLLLATSGTNLYPPGVWFRVVMSSFSSGVVTFVSFCSVFLFSPKPRPFVQSFFVLRYACASTVTRSYLTNVCVLMLKEVLGYM